MSLFLLRFSFLPSKPLSCPYISLVYLLTLCNPPLSISRNLLTIFCKHHITSIKKLTITIYAKMVKELRYMQNSGEVTPALLISHQRSSSYGSFPKLEPILEEGCENLVVVPKRVVYLLPVVLSLVLYFLLYKPVA